VLVVVTTAEARTAASPFSYSTPVDPYGWKGGSEPGDPYTKATNVPLWR